MRKTIALLAGLALISVACTDDGAGPERVQPPDRRIDEPGDGNGRREISIDDNITFVAALRTLGDCDAVLDHLRTEADARVGPYGFGYGGPMYYAEDSARAASDGGEGSSASAPAGGDADGDSGSGSDSFSTTNVQEAGVDEPDIVKTDGSRIVTIANGVLSVIDTTVEPAARVGAVTLGDDTMQPHELLVSGDRALVFGSGWVPDDDADDDAGEAGDDPIGGRGIGPWNPGRQLATITEVDLADASQPQVGATLRADGWYVEARLVGDTARVVLRSEPTELPFVYPQGEAGEDRAEASNREVVAESTIEDWMPSYELVAAGGDVTASGLLTECDSVEAPTEFAGFGTLSVLTFDAAAPLDDGEAVSVLAAGETVYASTEQLYVATTSYLDPLVLAAGDTVPPQWNEDYSTSIHAFDISGDAPATYVASGAVPGHLLNQFSMSEHDGNLRVATTKGAPWGGTEQSESLVTVLAAQGEQLESIGQVGDLGRGERIYSVRYAGDIAYVVTFRQTDPFYTVDLSDPAAPRVVGELKIPGYSAYLHPIGDDLVIGVGQDASAEGRVQGTKVSLFDVADLAAPVELATWTMANANSAAEWDHHAFLYWPATGQLVLPVNQWSERGDGTGFFGAVVLTVGRAGIAEVGRIEHDMVTPTVEQWCGTPEPLPAGDDVSVPEPGYECEPMPQPDMIQRSLVIGDELWTMAQWTMQVHNLADLTRAEVLPID